VAGSSDPLIEAREAVVACRWFEAADRFEEAGDVEPLGPDDLAGYSDALWWLGRMDEAVRVGAEAYRALLDEGRTLEAGRMALDIAVVHLLREDEPLASGWLEKVGRLVEDDPDSPLVGYFCLLVEVEGRLDSVRCPPGEAIITPDAEAVLDAARRVQECGRRFGDANLLATGLNGEGRVLLKLGRGDDGMARLDEAMVSVLSSEVDPVFAGHLYCNTMSACHEVVDVRRMRRWTDLTEDWVDTLPAAVLYNGICRVHRAQLLTVEGEWDRALDEATQVASDLETISMSVAAEAWYAIAEVHRLRGDRPGAEAAYREAHARGRDPHPGLALTWLDAGDTARAESSIRSALLAAGDDRLVAAHLHAAMVRIAHELGDLDAARVAAEALATTAGIYDSAGLRAMAATASGQVLAGDGRADEALGPLREACRVWGDLGAVHDAATTRSVLARVYRRLGDEASATMELERAAEVLHRLGARPALARLEPGDNEAGEPDRGSLTAREVEVLTLVAEGRSNRRVAEELFISDRTVARHLYNIFSKLGVGSRTEAARHALDHGLVRSTHR